jgi:ribosomal protein S18 acetylase RimI-like enzyme
MIPEHASGASAPGSASRGGESRCEARRDPAVGVGRHRRAGAFAPATGFAAAARPVTSEDALADIAVATSEADLEHVRALFRAYEREMDAACCFEGFEHELEHLAAIYAPPGFLLLATEEGRPIGCVGLRPLEPGIGEMKRLYVAPAARGTGIGGALTVRLLAEARTAGLRAARLETLPDKMPAAVALYVALGFQEIAPFGRRPLPDALYMEFALR